MKNARILAMSLCLLGVSAVALHSQQRAYSVPVSSRMIKLEVQVPEGRWVKGVVQEGDQLRIEDHQLGLTLAIVPVLQPDGVRVRVFQVEKREGGNESLHFIENINLGIGEPGFTEKALGVNAVKIVKVLESDMDRALDEAPVKGSCKAVRESSEKASVSGRCCVRCEETTTCGCAVEDSCGTCCAGFCCLV